MVNAYQCYCKLLENEKLEPMTHYDFQYKIACAWLDKDYFKTYNSSSETASVTTASTMTTSTRGRNTVCTSSVNPFTGSLKCRLNQGLPHWPSPAQSSYHCQLHYWASGIRKYKNIEICKVCNVALCTDDCYRQFHTEWELDMMKKECEDRSGRSYS